MYDSVFIIYKRCITLKTFVLFTFTILKLKFLINAVDRNYAYCFLKDIFPFLHPFKRQSDAERGRDRVKRPGLSQELHRVAHKGKSNSSPWVTLCNLIDNNNMKLGEKESSWDLNQVLLYGMLALKALLRNTSP